MNVALNTPESGRESAVRFVADHLAGLFCDSPEGSLRFKGGQAAAERQLRSFDVTGYAGARNEVAPQSKRASSGLSPYIRHGLLSLAEVWDRVEGGPDADVGAYRSELLWQEYARHWYARLGRLTRSGTRNQLKPKVNGFTWDCELACLDLSIGELEEEGWLVNQSRLWLASHMAIRSGADWRSGEDYFFTHLLDGSRAANRLGWQWATGVGSSRVYGFSRWQVEKRAAGLCASCDRVHNCPIENWPAEPELVPVESPVELNRDEDLARTTGPTSPVLTTEPESVWLTAESMGTRDPALTAHPDLPAIFVFDRPLLAKLQLSAKRLVFLVETLAELGQSRPVELYLGRPAEVVKGRKAAVTFAPVPGFSPRAAGSDLAGLYPYRWLRSPTAGTVATLESWKRLVNSDEHRDLAVSVE